MVQITVLSQCHLSVITVLSWFLTHHSDSRTPAPLGLGEDALETQKAGERLLRTYIWAASCRWRLGGGRCGAPAACGLRHTQCHAPLTGSGTHDAPTADRSQDTHI